MGEAVTLLPFVMMDWPGLRLQSLGDGKRQPIFFREKPKSLE